MKQLLLSILLATVAGAAFAQPCTPDPLYADSLYGIWPDTTTNFANGFVGVDYNEVLNLIVPVDAGVVNPAFNGVILDSVAFNGITGLPPGLVIACASQTAAPCSYLTGQLGCGAIQGIPTEAGTYELVLEVTAYSTLFGSVIPIPQSFTGYRIIIEEGTSVLQLAAEPLGEVRNVPNPFSTRTAIEFNLAKATQVRVSIFNLLGEELWATDLQGRAGANRVPFEAGQLQEGVYLFRVSTGNDTHTGRMVLNR
jgi:hypothetical protein